MAPITASITGFPPQKVDDERLRVLLESLCAVPKDCENLTERLATCVEPWHEWFVEEQVCLLEFGSVFVRERD